MNKLLTFLVNKPFAFLVICCLLSSRLLGGTKAYVDKNFLLKVIDSIKVQNYAVASPPKTQGKNEELFLASIKKYDFKDLSLPPRFDPVKTTRYGLFYNRSRAETLEDELNTHRAECYQVYVSKNKLFHVVKLNLNNKRRKFLLPEPFWNFTYCAGEDHRASDDIIYFFHGATGNVENWQNRKAMALVRKKWREKALLPKWASVSFGGLTLLSEKNNLERFTKVVAPFIERRLGWKNKRTPKSRFALGVSLGGANLIHATLKKPQFFRRAYLICPAIATLTPQCSREEINRYSLRTRAYRALLYLARSLSPYEFRKSQDYHKVDPLIIGQELFGPQTPPLFIQTSSQDEFGFQEGGKLIAMLARSRGAQVTFDELFGPHCLLTPEKVVDFFTKTPIEHPLPINWPQGVTTIENPLIKFQQPQTPPLISF